MEKHAFTIGSDPEFFLMEASSGKMISAIPFIRGTKEEPLPLPSGGGLQYDNVAVEFASPVATSAKEFVHKLASTIEETKSFLPPGHKLVALPSANFPEDQLQDEEACRFGCDPDYDAWVVDQNEPPFCEDITFRSAGAHIHLGSNGDDGNEFLLTFKGRIATARTMDCLHGIIFTVLDNSPEAVARRQLYGKPGSHRPKEYGIEYRALSNFWMRSPVTVMLVYYLAVDVLDIVRNQKADELHDAMDQEMVRETIMRGDEETAMRLIEEHLMDLMSEESISLFQEALAKVRANDMDFDKEWTKENIMEVAA